MIQKDDPRLTAFVLGELGAADLAELKKAIEASPELQQVVNEIRGTVAQLEESFRAESDLELPRPFDAFAETSVKQSEVTLPARSEANVSAARQWWLVASLAGVLFLGATFYLDLLPPNLVLSPGAPSEPPLPESDRNADEIRRQMQDLMRHRQASDKSERSVSSLSAAGSASGSQIAGARRRDVARERSSEEALAEYVRQIGSTATQSDQGYDSPVGNQVNRLDPDGDRFDSITDNRFQRVSEDPLSTFSIDVDTASYSKIRQSIFQARRLPRTDAVRIEEMVNYFHYNYEAPTAGQPFAAWMEVASCPWNANHRLARIAIQGQTMQADQRPPCNLVFLLDTSGSMNAENKMPLVKKGMKMLLEQLNQNDRVAIVTYAGSAGLALPSVPVTQYRQVEAALDRIGVGGNTNGGEGIQLAYQVARENLINNGVNRVILCTDGDFNVGTVGTDALVEMVERESKSGVYLSVLGFGMGNLNDSMLEQISGRGNGNYAFIDSQREARKVFIDQTSATLVTIAKDVKIQVEFNPAKVSGYRLLGYENRMLAKEDFNDDQIDAGEIGAGHQVTAIYELVPVDADGSALRPRVDKLKYQPAPQQEARPVNNSPELLTVKLRYKMPGAKDSTYVDYSVIDAGTRFEDASEDFRFATAVAAFGMQLRRSPYRGDWTYQDVLKTAKAAKGLDVYELRQEFLDLAHLAFQLNGEE